MQSIKESAANVAASAKAGLEKSRAVVQEKVERMSAHNPSEKEMATEKKEERTHHAERHKLEAREHNAAAAKQYSTTEGEFTGQHSTGGHQMPGHGTGQPAGHVTSEGIIHSHPIGTAAAAAAAARNTTAHI